MRSLLALLASAAALVDSSASQKRYAMETELFLSPVMTYVVLFVDSCVLSIVKNKCSGKNLMIYFNFPSVFWVKKYTLKIALHIILAINSR